MKFLPSAVSFLALFAASASGDDCNGSQETFITQLNFIDSEVEINTLHLEGGQLRFTNVGYHHNNKPLDIIVTVTSGSYTDIADTWAARTEASTTGRTWGPEKNGKVLVNGDPSAFANINLQTVRGKPESGRGNFRMCIVDQESDDEVRLERFSWTVFDADERGEDTNNREVLKEKMIIDMDQVDFYKLAPDTEIELRCEDEGAAISDGGTCNEGRTIFHSSTHGKGRDNPTDPDNLTDEQLARSVLFSFVNTACWDFTYDHYCPTEQDGSTRRCKAYDGGNFLFAGNSESLEKDGECITNSPTLAPTLSPTAATTSPTVAPTGAPTVAPITSVKTEPPVARSESPTAATGSPTAATDSPTVSPTVATDSPTMATATPTGSPTAATSSPTEATDSPTVSPTVATDSPTMATATPTGSPTAATVSPTAATDSPTVSPTAATDSPTMATATPTSNPTAATFSPTAATDSPTVSPTAAPTPKVTIVEAETPDPTVTPTAATASPTAATDSPTVSPTAATDSPTIATATPTGQPSLPPPPCPEDVVLLKTIGITPIELNQAVRVLSQDTESVTIRLYNAWTSSTDTVQSIFYQYKSGYNVKCYEKDNIIGGATYEDVTIQCLESRPYAELEIWIEDGTGNVLKEGDNAEIPKCCNSPTVITTPAVKYTMVIQCETVCNEAAERRGLRGSAV